MSRKLDTDLPWRQRLGLKVHQMMCSGCRNYEQQMRIIRIACRKISRGEQQQ